jgi:hypothetical protein
VVLHRFNVAYRYLLASQRRVRTNSRHCGLKPRLEQLEERQLLNAGDLVIVVGGGEVDGSPITSTLHLLLARFNPDGSPEYLGEHSSDPIGAIYQTLLDRPADPSGEAAWRQAVANGLSYYSLAIDFIQSAEYAQNETQALYLKYLRRSPDPSGLAAFTSFFEQGGTLEQAQAIMLGSSEYFNLV